MVYQPKQERKYDNLGQYVRDYVILPLALAGLIAFSGCARSSAVRQDTPQGRPPVAAEEKRGGLKDFIYRHFVEESLNEALKESFRDIGKKYRENEISDVVDKEESEKSAPK